MTAGRYPYNHGGIREITPALHDIGGRPVYGAVLFVDSNNSNAGDTASDGQKRQPFSTIDDAINQCKGDETIYIAPGHTELITSADQIDCDVEGVSIIGCGNGTRRPTLRYTVAAGEFVVGASNVHIENIRFIAEAPDVLKAIDIEAGVDYTEIKNCEFIVLTAGTHEFANTITLADANIGTMLDGCLIDNRLGNSVQAIHMDNATTGDIRTTIQNCRIVGDYSEACITSDTQISVEILIQKCILQNGDSAGNNAQPTLELGASSGIIADCYHIDGTATDDASAIATAAVFFNNQWSTTVASGKGIITTPSVWT